MHKLFLFLVALTLSVGLWAVDNVAYIDATGALQHQDDVTEITGSIETLNAGWYVVNGDFVIDNRITCSGEVHLILADGFTLKVMRGITVSGTGNALTIYAQTEDIEHMGQLIATGEYYAAGIGGGPSSDGSYITINGGKVEATGDSGGISTAVAESDNDNVKAIATNAINTINASTNLHEIEAIKAQALAAIASAKAAYTEGKAEGIEEGDAAGYERGYEEGDAAGYQRAKDELPTDAQDAAGHTVTIIKGDKTLKLVNPEKVEFGKQ